MTLRFLRMTQKLQTDPKPLSAICKTKPNSLFLIQMLTGPFKDDCMALAPRCLQTCTRLYKLGVSSTSDFERLCWDGSLKQATTPACLVFHKYHTTWHDLAPDRRVHTSVTCLARHRWRPVFWPSMQHLKESVALGIYQLVSGPASLREYKPLPAAHLTSSTDGSVFCR